MIHFSLKEQTFVEMGINYNQKESRNSGLFQYIVKIVLREGVLCRWIQNNLVY